jgi:hypothetical protein
MEPHEAIVQALNDLRDEAKAWRELQEKHTKHWYSREPFKSLVTHTATLCLAVGIGYTFHACTGTPISIETASRSHDIELPPIGAGSAPEIPSGLSRMADTVSVVEPIIVNDAAAPRVFVVSAPKIVRPSISPPAPVPAAAAPTAVDAK